MATRATDATNCLFNKVTFPAILFNYLDLPQWLCKKVKQNYVPVYQYEDPLLHAKHKCQRVKTDQKLYIERYTCRECTDPDIERTDSDIECTDPEEGLREGLEDKVR